MAEILAVPYLGTAESEVAVLDWRRAPGESFRRGEVLCTLETLKASFELEAEEDGVLRRILVEPGARVPVGAVLALYDRPGAESSEAELDACAAEAARQRAAEGPAERAGSGEAPAEQASEATSGTRRGAGAEATPAAPAARRLAAELGIDLARLKGSGPGGLVLEADVRAAAGGAGRLDPAFVDHLRSAADAFARLPGPFKLDLYRRAGARIAEDVVLGPGAVVLAEVLVLGEGVRIDEDVRIEAVRFEAGAGSWIRRGARLRCRRIVLGENAYFAPEAEVGGGGAMDPEAVLEVGSHGFVGERTHLNPCRPIRIGDEVVISREAVLMTHSFGQSVLDGYPQRFGGLSIGDRAQIGIGCVLFPGVSVGEGAILLSGSSLVTDLPAGRLYGGVPAKDLKAAARPLSPAEKRELAQRLVEEFAGALERRGFTLGALGRADEQGFAVEHEGRRHVLRFRERGPFAELGETPAEEVRVALFRAGAYPREEPPEVAAILLEPPEISGPAGPLRDAFREFLRKRGIRLHPRTWSYRGGWL